MLKVNAERVLISFFAQNCFVKIGGLHNLYNVEKSNDILWFHNEKKVIYVRNVKLFDKIFSFN